MGSDMHDFRGVILFNTKPLLAGQYLPKRVISQPLSSFHELLPRAQSPAIRSSSGIQNHHYQHHHQFIRVHGSSALPGEFEAEKFHLNYCCCCCCYPEPVSRSAVERTPADPERSRFKRGTAGQDGGYNIHPRYAPRNSRSTRPPFPSHPGLLKEAKPSEY